jgi:hypothetical protein
MANLSNINNKFLVTTGGNVLIGATATSVTGSALLQVTGDSDFIGSSGRKMTISPNTTSLDVVNYPLHFKTGNQTPTEKMRIDTVGNVMIGIESVLGSAILTIKQGNYADTGLFLVQGDGNDDKGWGMYSRTNGTFRINRVGATTITPFLIDTSGNVGIGTNSPDGKLEVAGGTTLGFRLSNAGDSSAYDQVRMTYGGYNSGAPTVTFMPLTTPGGGNVDTTFHFMNTNGLNANNNRANVNIDGILNVGSGRQSGETTLIMRNYDASLVDSNEIQNSIRMSGRYWSGSASQLVETRINSVHQESNGNGGSALTFWTQTGGSASTEQMRIDKVGNVGIGTDSPTGYKLVIQNTAEDMIKLHNSTDGLDSLISFTNPGGTLARIQGLDNGGLQFDTGNNAGGLNTNVMYMSNSGNVGIGTNLPNATLHVNGGVHFGTDSAVLNPTNGQVLIETVAGGTPRLQMYVYGSSVFDISSDGTTGNIGWSSGASREVNFQNTGAGDIKVGIATGAPTQPLDVNGYSICDKQFQRDNTLQTILNTPRVLNIGYQGANGTYTFNPVTLFGNNPQGGQCEIQVTGWQSKVNNGFIYWRDNGSNTNIGNGIVGFVQTAVVGSGAISVSTNGGTNNITITFTGWHSNAHGWNCKIISYQA